MRKACKKLSLSRETLRNLQAKELRGLWGGDSFAFGCESGSCPNDCGTQACATAGCTGSAACPQSNDLYYTCVC